MHLLRTPRLILTFYRNFFGASMLITVCCAGLVWKWGMDMFTTLFWFKLVSLGLIFYFVRNIRRDEFYYYQNLGVSRTLLWAASLGLDFCLFLLALIASASLR
jgi:hypothetical protein